MKKITILGVTGLVGKNLLQKAISSGFEVKVLVRDKNKLRDIEQDFEVIEGSYFDQNILRNALEGSDVILSTIGPPMNSNISSEDEKQYVDSLAYIIKQMHENRQSRWINISGAGVKLANENLPLARKLLRVTIKTASKSIINIKDKELQLLEQSSLEWTNIRPPVIKEKEDGEFAADEHNFIGMAVDLNQLTDFILNEITANEWVKKAPVIGTK